MGTFGGWRNFDYGLNYGNLTLEEAYKKVEELRRWDEESKEVARRRAIAEKNVIYP